MDRQRFLGGAMASTKGFSRDRTATFGTIRQREHIHRHTFEER